MTQGKMPNYEEQLQRLYSLQAEASEDTYLHAHSRNRAVIRRQVAIFDRCHEFFKDAHTVLDWGCRHAADACMVRMLCGPTTELHGCDIDDASYKAFFDFAGLKYSRITHPYLLPYEDDSFDVVIGSGVLEHVPNDSESLKELYRIVRPGGHFMMTMLPNKGSYTEWLNRRLGNPAHLRLYSLAEAKHMFMHHGFRPVVFGYHQIVPTLSSPAGGIFDSSHANRFVEWAFGFNSFLERLWPINKLSTNIFIIGQKVRAFHG
jgi:ubiquinone/menaquinone biosynthesis C-methylase UbiE